MVGSRRGALSIDSNEPRYYTVTGFSKDHPTGKRRLSMRDVQNEAKKFWEEKEAEKGGKVSFYTFATFLGRSSDRHVTNGGLIYRIGERVYFEDFE